MSQVLVFTWRTIYSHFHETRLVDITSQHCPVNLLNKALVYQGIIKMLMLSLSVFPDIFIIIASVVLCGKIYVCAWAPIRQRKAQYNDLNGLLIHMRLVD